jgi:hypothetical protein
VGPGAAACQSAEPGFSWQQDATSLAWVGPQGVVWRYRFAPELPKPYFDPVSLVTGEALTWNEPPDHAWHHGLWFSWHTINGIDYWKDLPETGRPDGRTSWSAPQIETEATGAARIQMQLKYSHQDQPPVLTERRVIEISAVDAGGGYALDWDCTWSTTGGDVVLDRTPIPPDPEGKPWGGYAGLSLRLAKDLSDRRLLLPGGEAEFDATGVHRSANIACEYQGHIGDRPVGIAVISHPQNPRDPTPFYAIRSEMSYLNPAFLEQSAYTLRPDQPLRLCYRVAVHPDRWDSAQLTSEAEAYRTQK